MGKRLNGSNIITFCNNVKLETRLQDILNEDIVNQEGLVLLNHFKHNLKNTNYPDATGQEMFVNKFHVDIDSKGNKKDSAKHFLQQAIVFSLSLHDKLINAYPNKHFNIIILTDEGPDSYPDVCTVGFHTIRPNEHWLTENLEDYKTNGLLVITV